MFGLTSDWLPSLTFLLAVPMIGLFGLSFASSGWADRHAGWYRASVTHLLLVQFLVSAVMTIGLGVGWVPIGSVLYWSPTTFLPEGLFSLSLRIDGTSLLMLTLVSFVGWVTGRFAFRYLDGEPHQGRYFRFVSWTIGAVCVMATSGNLLMLSIAWVATSLGLHQLLVHYQDRAPARRAARLKFVISRIGDVALFAGCGLLYRLFGTLELNELFVLAMTPSGPSQIAIASVESGEMGWVGFLFVLTAMTKSAQLPFHSWLPQTMETPTPVSALMHAGVVNAGGYLLIRTSPLMMLAPEALQLLAIVGAATAVFASLVMLTQTNVKKSLAYSTVAQMGFMMLQCGLGAFAAAMLHLLAHSLYKANAFLRTGSVLNDRRSMVGATWKSLFDPDRSLVTGWATLSLGILIAASGYALSITVLGLNVSEKPGGFVLGYVLCLALSYWVANVIVNIGTWAAFGMASLSAVTLSFVYVASFVVVDAMIADPLVKTPLLITNTWAITLIAFGFAFLFVIPVLIGRPPRWAAAFYVHATHGFYVDAIEARMLRRVFNLNS
ncbi:proton-conducting transporter transmembrane domain-containing protein [Neorhodopirellula pilleata]|uniref:Probable inorganic carbon transporter subunit DabB n=1 Tax=Neorhodopirellula pilleata TaxID=2714738 RepID=A0A5C6AVF8_9BACT|nr:proton-conducting transporter membrane subunit [Neorhodopirellula pilleata]TWU03578.1 NADH-quinone oxidoreductase subunit L [Neorhodopirellula pilleata]